jgi:hypothetical protein
MENRMTDNNHTTPIETPNTSNVLPFSGAAGTFNGTAALHLDHAERAEGLPPGWVAVSRVGRRPTQ